MDANGENLGRRWKIMQEQLTTLWAYHKRSPAAKEFSTFLKEGFTSTTMSLSMFTQICYFLLGIINKEERDKLIKWPVMNLQRQVTFRKGVSAIVKGLIQKYPHVSLRQLPDSYMIDPSLNQKKIIDFVMKLANLAVYLTLNDPLLLEMRPANDLTASEIEIATTMIRRARISEEKLIEENKFPIEKFENIRENTIAKCVALKTENSKLVKKLNKLKKELIENGLLQKDEDCNVNYLKNICNEKLSELIEINNQLKVYSNLSKEIVNNLKVYREPVALSAEDVGLGKGCNSLADATSEAYEKLIVTCNSMKCIDALPEEKEDYLKILEDVRNALLEEKNGLQSFMKKYAQDVNTSSPKYIAE